MGSSIFKVFLHLQPSVKRDWYSQNFVNLPVVSHTVVLWAKMFPHDGPMPSNGIEIYGQRQNLYVLFCSFFFSEKSNFSQCANLNATRAMFHLQWVDHEIFMFQYLCRIAHNSRQKYQANPRRLQTSLSITLASIKIFTNEPFGSRQPTVKKINYRHSLDFI